MHEILTLPPDLLGDAWPHRAHGWAHRRMHRHEELEFNLVLAGRARYIVDDQRYDLSPGTLIWLFPAQNHLLIDESADFAMWIVVLRPRFLARTCRSVQTRPLLAVKPEGVLCRRLDQLTTQQLSDLLAREFATGTGQADRRNACLAYALMRAWEAHQRAASAEVGRDVHPAVARAAELLRQNPNALSLMALATRCGLSTPRLSRLFKRQAGLSLAAFRSRQRLQRFLDLYGRGRRLTITQAALQAGFGSYPQFHRVFHQIMGCGPADYRRRQSSGNHVLPAGAVAPAAGGRASWERGSDHPPAPHPGENS